MTTMYHPPVCHFSVCVPTDLSGSLSAQLSYAKTEAQRGSATSLKLPSRFKGRVKTSSPLWLC